MRLMGKRKNPGECLLPIQILLPAELLERLNHLASIQGVSRNRLIREVLDQCMGEPELEGEPGESLADMIDRLGL